MRKVWGLGLGWLFWGGWVGILLVWGFGGLFICFGLFFLYTPCGPAMSHGDPQLEGALHPQLGLSGHPGRKAIVVLQVNQTPSMSQEGLRPSWKFTWVAKWMRGTYFWRQSSSDTDDHLLLIMVHSHIERCFINLENIQD